MTDHTPKCPRHPDVRALRNEKYDAYYCSVCDTWLERRCRGPCEFCAVRPERPSQA